jgi:hypothetical protein
MSLVCFVRPKRAGTTACRTPGEAFICQENSETMCVGMAKCRHSVEWTTSHRDGGAMPIVRRRPRATWCQPCFSDCWARDERASAERATWEHEVDREQKRRPAIVSCARQPCDSHLAVRAAVVGGPPSRETKRLLRGAPDASSSDAAIRGASSAIDLVRVGRLQVRILVPRSPR